MLLKIISMFFMIRNNKITLTCFVMVYFYLSLTLFAEIEVTVKNKNQSPQILVNGKAVRPRMFWGAERGTAIHLDREWREYSFDVGPDFDSNASWHFRFEKKIGLIWIRDIKVVDVSDNELKFPLNSFASEESFNENWNVFPPDEKNTVGKLSITDSTLRILLKNPSSGGDWPDFHLYSDYINIPAGKTYRFSFRAKASSTRSVYPGVYHVDQGWTLIGSPESPFVKQLKMAKKAGTRFITFNVSACWFPPEEIQNWQALDYSCQRILKTYPEAILIPRVGMDAPKWWLERNEDAYMVYEDGSKGEKASVSHEKYREEAASHLERLCRHLREVFPDNLGGIHPSGQNTGEWFYEGTWKSKLCGYGPAVLKAWRASEKGGLDVPAPSLRRNNGNKIFLDPDKQKDVIDFNRFLQDEMADFIISLAAAARRGLGNNKLVMFFYGYHYEFGAVHNGPAVSGHYGLKKVLDYPDIDILCGPLSYFDRQPGGSGPFMSSAESVAASGKLWLNEDDTRTFLSTNIEDHDRYGGPDDLAETRRVLLRNSARAVLRGAGDWWMDHGAGTEGGWFAHEGLWEIRERLKSLDCSMLNRTKPYSPELAVIFHENSMFYLAGGNNFVGRELIYSSRAALGRCGLSYGDYLLRDVLSGNARGNMKIFLNAWALSRDERNLLKQNRKPGETWVWCYAPGYLSENSASLEGMKDLTGFKLGLSDNRGCLAYPTELGKEYGMTSPLGKDLSMGPLFYVREDSTIEILARYMNGEGAVAIKKNHDRADVFIGPPSLSSDLIRAIAKSAGFVPITNKDALVCQGENYLLAHGVDNGPLNLNIKKDVEVMDVMTGMKIGKGPIIPVNLSKGETLLLTWEHSNGASIKEYVTDSYRLYNNYPNPFHDETMIRYSIGSSEHVEIAMFNLLGEKVEIIIDADQGPGIYEKMWNSSSKASGIYFIKMKAGSFSKIMKILLVR